MFDLLFKNACMANGKLANIAISDGKIAAISTANDSNKAGPAARHIIDLTGDIHVSAGWIDSHVHCNPASPVYFDQPDTVGVKGGVTTIIDAGSTGADTITAFREQVETSRTNVRALLNISKPGINRQNELSDLEDIDVAAAGEAISRHRGFLVGIKARMSGSVIGNNGLRPLELARKIQDRHGDMPLMVHFGNPPPLVTDLLDALEGGDILTHCYHGKPNGILTPDGEPREALKAAMARGILLDVGHGGASFAFTVAERALQLGIGPDTISSDIYSRNRIDGPVYGLAEVMSKFLMLGMPLAQVIDCVTVRAAAIFDLPGKGQLRPGMDADLTLFSLSDTPVTARDSEGQQRQCASNIVPLAAVVAGEIFTTKHGRDFHDFIQ